MKATTTLRRKLGITKQEARALFHLAKRSVNDGELTPLIEAEFEVSNALNISLDSATDIISELIKRDLCWTDDLFDTGDSLDLICNGAVENFLRYRHEPHLDRYLRRQQRDGITKTAELVLRIISNSSSPFDPEIQNAAEKLHFAIEDLAPYEDMLIACKGERDVTWAACLAFGQWSLNRASLALANWLPLIQPDLIDRAALRQHLNADHIVFTQGILEPELEAGKVVGIKPTEDAREKYNLDRDYEPELNK